MAVRLIIESRAKKDLQSLDPLLQKRIAKKLKFFIGQDDPLQFAKKLINSKDGDFRWRIGNFRVVFDTKKESIIILRVQHRKDVYR